jgi:hypothetical protein
MWDVWHKQYAGGCTIATKRQIVWSLTRHSPGCSGWGRGLAERTCAARLLPCVTGLSWSTVVKTDLGSFTGEGTTTDWWRSRGGWLEAGPRHNVSMVSGAVESEIDPAEQRRAVEWGLGFPGRRATSQQGRGRARGTLRIKSRRWRLQRTVAQTSID